MIRKTKELSEKLLDELNEYVLGKTGYEVEFIIKPMNEGFDIPADELENIEIPTKQELKEEAKAKEKEEAKKRKKLWIIYSILNTKKLKPELNRNFLF